MSWLSPAFADEPDADVPACQTDLRLSGTVYDAREPDRSFAVFHVQPKRSGEVYRPGSWVGAFELLDVEPRGVLLRGEQGECWLRLLSTRAPKATAPAAPANAPSSQRSRKAAFSAAELDRVIRRLGPETFEVNRSLLQEAVARAAQLSRATRVRPVRRFGSVAGLRLQSMPQDGLLARLGLARGDLVKTLNGLPLASLDGALQAQTMLASTSRLSLAVVRNGQPITLAYNVVP